MRSSRRTLGLQPEVVPDDSESDDQVVGQSDGTNEDVNQSEVNENVDQTSVSSTDIVLGNEDEESLSSSASSESAIVVEKPGK